MKKKSYGMLAMSLLLGLASCSDEVPWSSSDSEGSIKLELSADGRIMSQTRAQDGDETAQAPGVEEFSVSLKTPDGSFSKIWNSVDQFNAEAGFSVGEYILAGFYGDINTEGFEKPYFYGQTSVNVYPGSQETAHITATLANSMVSIRYSDKFKESFSAYSSAIQSEGHEWVVFAGTETRPAYVAPGEIKLNLTLTNYLDKQVTIQPASFQAQPRHHYVVNLDVTENLGELTLNVVFEENVVNETVEVSLGDDLFNSPAPTVSISDSDTDEVTFSGYEYVTELPSAEFKVVAFGGLSKANLNIITESNYTPSFGKSIQLVGATALEQQQLASEGIECIGFFKIVDKMGVVKVGDFLKKLPAGDYTIELEAVDNLTRVSEPSAKIHINLNKVEWGFASEQTPVDFGATKVAVDITTNCEAIKDAIKFKAPDANNRMADVPESNVEVTSTDNGGTYTLHYVLTVDPQTNSNVDIHATFGGNTIYTKVPVNGPDLKVEADAFARYAVLQFSGSAVADESVINNIRVYKGGKEVSATDLVFDAARKQIIIKGLTPSTEYADYSVKLSNYDLPVESFTTEATTALANGDFEASSNTINLPNINVGGVFQISAVGVKSNTQLYTTISKNTADGWADLNQLTCFPGSSNPNTWYMVPSTWVENGQAVIQSVGYHHNGESIPTDTKGTSMAYYSTKVPAQLNVSTGELFLGSYPFGVNESSRTDGVEWRTRPSSLSFEYQYVPQVDTEEGEAYIQVIGADGAVLSQQTVYLPAASSMTQKTVQLSDYKFGVKAASIKIGFKSTKTGQTPVIHKPTGSELKEDEVNTNNYRGEGSWSGLTHNGTLKIETYKAKATGSTLTIDNVVLGYDFKAPAASPVNAKKSNKRR